METLNHRRLLSTAEAAATSEMANSTTTEAELNQPNVFGTNMVIILAVLLCAMICALGLNSVVRCALRFSRRGTTAVVTGGPGCGDRGGLRRNVLEKVPIYVYGRDHQGGAIGGGGEECPICLGEFVDGDKVRVLPKCNHGFHVKCIDTWLGLHSSCPNCRLSVVDGGGGGSRDDEVVVEISGRVRILN
ncbi:hypothetical protein vseg_014503 [Gypsophila vaccaria]